MTLIPSKEERNKYDVPKWLIEALKSYDGLMSSEKGKIKGNKMKAKRELLDLITKHEVEARKKETTFWLEATKPVIKDFLDKDTVISNYELRLSDLELQKGIEQ